MDLKLNREKLVCAAVSSEEEIAQTAEHDFLLPDYCPDIFRVLKCQIIPGITSTGINGSRLTFELNVIIRVLYRSTDSDGIFCVEQSLDFSKTAELPPDAQNPSVSITPYVEYVNCRVANQRRLDVRGNVVCKVRIETEKCYEAVCGAYGSGLQLKTVPVSFPSKRFTSAKRITVIEELELAAGKPPFGCLLGSRASIRKGEQKIVMGKLITKGEVGIDLLYLTKDSASAPEAMNFSVPFSQIIDVEGIDEECDVDVDIVSSKCSVVPKNGSGGELECELVLLVNVTAAKYETAELAVDAYSTMYECECETLPEIPELFCKRVSSSVFAETEMRFSDGEVKQIYDLWTEGLSACTRYDESAGKHMLCGKVTFCMLGQVADGSPAYAEKECAFEQPLDLDTDECRDHRFASARIDPERSSYTICEDGSVKASGTFSVYVKLNRSGDTPLLHSIEIMSDKPKKCDKRCAAKICYSTNGESLWDIAKKYSTSADAISEENPSDEGDRRILIIPIKN